MILFDYILAVLTCIPYNQYYLMQVCFTYIMAAHNKKLLPNKNSVSANGRLLLKYLLKTEQPNSENYWYWQKNFEKQKNRNTVSNRPELSA